MAAVSLHRRNPRSAPSRLCHRLSCSRLCPCSCVSTPPPLSSSSPLYCSSSFAAAGLVLSTTHSLRSIYLLKCFTIALKKADIGISVADATDAARGASDIVLTEPGLSVIISAVLTSRAIFQRMKNYTIYAVSITIRIVFCFMFVALIWKFDFSPFMVFIMAILNDGTIMTISKDRVKPSPLPDSWKLREIFATGIVLGSYLALMTVIFFWAMKETHFFPLVLY